MRGRRFGRRRARLHTPAAPAASAADAVVGMLNRWHSEYTTLAKAITARVIAKLSHVHHTGPAAGVVDISNASIRMNSHA